LPSQTHTHEGDAVKVLIVEDEPLLALVLAEQLVELGYAVCATARDEYEAVSKATHHKPDIVLMDLRLAKGTCGASAARQLYNFYGIRCIFVSANLDAETQKQLAPLRPLAFLEKPFLSADLKSVLAKVAFKADREPAVSSRT
jgi:two-component system, response regulator PdtaR